MNILPKSPEQKRSVIYTLITLSLICLIGCIGFFSDDFSEGYKFSMLLFFILGVIHVWTLFEFLPFRTGSLLKEVGFTALLSVIGILLIIIIYQFKVNNWQMGLGFGSAVVAFVFPIMALQAYHFFQKIPQPVYKKWYYPVGKDLPDIDLLDLSKVLVIQFEFTKTNAESTFTNFKAKAPVEMLFGDLFFIFLNDYNDRNPQNQIEYLDENKQPYGWNFYKKDAWYKGRHYYDPELNFQANGIIDNETIVAVRG